MICFLSIQGALKAVNCELYGQGRPYSCLPEKRLYFQCKKDAITCAPGCNGVAYTVHKSAETHIAHEGRKELLKPLKGNMPQNTSNVNLEKY
jgi:hypothetical protein